MNPRKGPISSLEETGPPVLTYRFFLYRFFLYRFFLSRLFLYLSPLSHGRTS